MLAQVRLNTSLGKAEKDDTYIANVVSTSSTTATIEITQIYATLAIGGWDASSDLHIDWMAWSAGMCADSKVATQARGLSSDASTYRSCLEGSSSFIVPSNGATGQHWVPLATGSDNGNGDVNDNNFACTSHSYALGSVNGASSGGLAFTTFGFNCTHIGINVISANVSPAAGMAITTASFDWLVTESVTVEWPILDDPVYIQIQNHQLQPVASAATLTVHVGPLVQEVAQVSRLFWVYA
jgi:hypothetical protein